MKISYYLGRNIYIELKNHMKKIGELYFYQGSTYYIVDNKGIRYYFNLKDINFIAYQ